MKRTSLAAGLALALFGGVAISVTAWADAPAAQPGEVPVKLTGGYDTDGRDRGRPVILVASALGVTPDVFRDAFSHVHPAQHDGGPTRDEAQQNKHELLSRLEKYGVTNERLDEVSNYYRYRRENGEMWKHRDAVIFATVKDGNVTGFRIADAGAGYSSLPTFSIDGKQLPTASSTVHFDKDVAKNGSIDLVSVAPPTTAP